MSFEERLDLAGRTLLVTGAAAGIGRATVIAAAAHGAGELVLVDLDESGLEEVVRHLPRARAHVADASDFAAMSQLLARVGKVDLLVNAAGNITSSGFADL